MPVHNLLLKAELDNVESIVVSDDIIWRMKIHCSNCQEISPSFVEVSQREVVEVQGTRGTCNCLYTCKLCHRKIQIDVIAKTVSPYNESEKFSKIVSFEGRGGEPCEFQPADGFIITTESGAIFRNVDLQDDFAEYDEDAGQAVSVVNMEWKFEYSCFLTAYLMINKFHFTTSN